MSNLWGWVSGILCRLASEWPDSGGSQKWHPSSTTTPPCRDPWRRVCDLSPSLTNLCCGRPCRRSSLLLVVAVEPGKWLLHFEKGAGRGVNSSLRSSSLRISVWLDYPHRVELQPSRAFYHRTPLIPTFHLFKLQFGILSFKQLLFMHMFRLTWRNPAVHNS